jgi:hypothetical protein
MEILHFNFIYDTRMWSPEGKITVLYAYKIGEIEIKLMRYITLFALLT